MAFPVKEIVSSLEAGVPSPKRTVHIAPNAKLDEGGDRSLRKLYERDKR